MVGEVGAAHHELRNSRVELHWSNGMRSAEPGGRVLLGWEFAGVVSAVGAAVARFRVGDRVFGTGDMT
jgi:NADPH:quinone reductase-like Zn-dependent oxidoreductase